MYNVNFIPLDLSWWEESNGSKIVLLWLILMAYNKKMLSGINFIEKMSSDVKTLLDINFIEKMSSDYTLKWSK